MIAGIGKVNQIGYVVRDINKALDFWVNVLGVGPWYVRHPAVEHYVYRGVPGELNSTIALANSGDMQIELIQDDSDGPTFYKEFLSTGREGIHHVSFWQEEEQFDSTAQRLVQAGFYLVHSGDIGGQSGRFAYYIHDAQPGIVIEISSVSGAKGERFQRIAQAAKQWDGSDPIRHQ